MVKMQRRGRGSHAEAQGPSEGHGGDGQQGVGKRWLEGLTDGLMGTPGLGGRGSRHSRDPAGAGTRSWPEDRRRELERGARSSESEVQTYRPKGHLKMRGGGAPRPPPLERVRRTSGRGERGCSKRTL